MTTQDADDADTDQSDADRDDVAEDLDEIGGDEPPESIGDVLSEIGTAPDGDVEDVLDAITDESKRDGDSDEKSEDRNGGDDESDGDSEEVTAESGSEAGQSEVDVEGSFVEEVEKIPAETLARTVLLLRNEIDRLETALEEERDRADDLESRLARKQADFQNYKKRQKERIKEEKQRATEDLVTRLLDVRDNLERALDQDEDADIRGGVESTLDQFDQQLERENVEPIDPTIGDSVDPVRHEVLVTVESDQPEDTIAQIHRPGYEMAGKVLRPAQVAVSDGSNHDDEVCDDDQRRDENGEQHDHGDGE